MVATSVAYQKNDADCFDHSVIDGLADIMTTSALRSLLVDMARDASLRIERVAEVQVASGSLKLIAQDAHDLKSMGGNFGLTGLSNCAAVVERAARGGCLESVRASMPSLISIGRKSIKTLVNRHEINCERAS